METLYTCLCFSRYSIEEDLLKVYVGERSRDEAERLCPNRLSFRLYNRVTAKDDYHRRVLQLYIVYCSYNGSYRFVRLIDILVFIKWFYSHFKLVSEATIPKKWRINIPEEPAFGALSDLVKYYQTYGMICDDAGRCEMFPMNDDNYDVLWYQDDKAQLNAISAQNII